MKNIKKISAIALILVLVLGVLTACGGNSGGGEEDKVIKVAATATPHAEVLDFVKDKLAEDGWDLQVTVVDGYDTENPGTEDGDFDANYFQHVPYLNQYNEENNGTLVAVGDVHYEAMGIYKAKKDSIEALEKGDKIAVPNDVTNEARALALLADNGIITLKDGVGLNATKNDIVDNPYGIEIEELDAAVIPNSRPDFALAVINANFALGAGLTTDDAVVYEAADSEAAETYVNVIVVKEENKDSEKTKALVAAIQTEEVKQFILDTYKGAVQPKF